MHNSLRVFDQESANSWYRWVVVGARKSFLRLMESLVIILLCDSDFRSARRLKDHKLYIRRGSSGRGDGSISKAMVAFEHPPLSHPLMSPRILLPKSSNNAKRCFNANELEIEQLEWQLQQRAR